MKKVLLLSLAAVSLALAAWAATTHNDANKATPIPSETETNASRESGKCVCGGSLTTDFHAFHHKKTCPSCHGKGTLGRGEYKQTCKMCNGTGEITVYEAGYRCTSCNRVYREW